MSDAAIPAVETFLSKVMNVIFQSSFLKNIIQVLVSTVAIEIINLFFGQLKKSGLGQLPDKLNLSNDAFINIINVMVARGDVQSAAGDRLISLFSDIIKSGQGFALTFPYVYTSEYLKQLTGIVSGQLYQEYNSLFRPNPPDPSLVMPGFRFGGGIASGIMDILKRNGISDADIAIMGAATQSPLPANTVLSAYNKGILDRETAKSILYELGLSTDNTDIFIDGQTDIPDISTLIAISLANGFDDSAAEILGTDSTMPAVWPFFIQSLGINKEFASYAWRARFTMPSIDFFYAAVQRGFLSPSDMHLYYNMIGIPPNLYDMMDTLVTTPLSTDYATQAYQQHIIDETKYRQIIKSNGADNETVDIIVQLANAAANPTAASGTVQNILYALEDGFISQEVCKNMLIDLGFTSPQADLQIQLAQYQQHYTLNKALISAIESQFKNGSINGNDAFQQLINIGINNEQAQADIQLWMAQAKVGAKTLDYTQIVDLIKAQILHPVDAIPYLVKLGYSSTDAAYLSALLLKEYGG